MDFQFEIDPAIFGKKSAGERNHERKETRNTAKAAEEAAYEAECKEKLHAERSEKDRMDREFNETFRIITEKCKELQPLVAKLQKLHTEKCKDDMVVVSMTTEEVFHSIICHANRRMDLRIKTSEDIKEWLKS